MPPDILLARNMRGQTVRVDPRWIIAVVADRAWDVTVLHLIDGQCLTVDLPFEEVAEVIQDATVTMH